LIIDRPAIWPPPGQVAEAAASFSLGQSSMTVPRRPCCAPFGPAVNHTAVGPPSDASPRSNDPQARDARRRRYVDSDVAGGEELGTFDLPDEDDEHLVAAAVRGTTGVW
jgi:hypothetical protein